MRDAVGKGTQGFKLRPQSKQPLAARQRGAALRCNDVRGSTQDILCMGEGGREMMPSAAPSTSAEGRGKEDALGGGDQGIRARESRGTLVGLKILSSVPHIRPHDHTNPLYLQPVLHGSMQLLRCADAPLHARLLQRHKAELVQFLQALQGGEGKGRKGGLGVGFSGTEGGRRKKVRGSEGVSSIQSPTPPR